MARSVRNLRLLLAVLATAILLLMCSRLSTGPAEPVYKGKRLGQWLRGHPSEYLPAVQAIGTNALPYLLSELKARDSALKRLAQKTLDRVSIRPGWHSPAYRRYHAGLALQILDTNALPPLMDMLFSSPMRSEVGNPGFSAAGALRLFNNPTALTNIEQRLTRELQSPDSMRRRNACLALCWHPHPSAEGAEKLAALTRDEDPTVRVASVRALLYCRSRDELFTPALIDRLDDEQAAVRRLAVAALHQRMTNAASAAPALRRAYAQEPGRHGPRGDLGNDYFRAEEFLPGAIQSAIRVALDKIDPGSAPP